MRHVDALSRSIGILVVEDNPFEVNLALCQSRDHKLKNIQKGLKKGESKLYEMRNGLVFRKRGEELLFYVPKSMENQAMHKYHDEMGHIGTEKTTTIILRSYWFPNLRDKVETHIRNCLKCISYSPSSGKAEGFLHSIPKGNISFMTLHIDHFGPVDKQRLLKRYVFLVVDSFTKYVKLYATKTTSTKEAIDCLSQYFANYSRPKVIISDRGSCFTSVEFKEFLDDNNVKHIKIATGSPKANGQVERVNRILTPIGKINR